MKNTLLMLLLSASTTQATLVVNITGTPGDGFSTITFSGSSTTSSSASFRTTGATGWTPGDAFQASLVPGDSGSPSFISNAAIQDILYTFTGAASITIGATTQNITQIFLDQDGSGDDMGFRVGTQLNYAIGEASSWTGSGTIPVDMSSFNFGTFYNLGVFASFATANANGINLVIGAASPIPEPSTYLAVASASFLIGLIGYRRLRKNKNQQANEA